MRVKRLSRRRGCQWSSIATLAVVAIGCPAWLAGVAADAVSGGAVPAANAAGLAVGSWGTAIEVPGLAALDTRGRSEVNSVSCGLAGICAAGGDYSDSQGGQGFVAVERDGVWGTAIEVPGLGALNSGGGAQVNSVSCGPAGGCVAGGGYADRQHHLQGFVAVERHGAWRRAIEVPGLGALNTGGDAQVGSVSCISAGSCAIGGLYQARGHSQGFVAVERSGVWRRAVEVPGLGALNKGGFAQVSSVSCGSAGSCAAGGVYEDQHFTHQGFLADERDGTWGKAIEVPGLAALNKEGAQINSVSCISAGNCAAGGSYSARGSVQGFVADEANGTWGTAIEVPGLAALNKGGAAQVESVSCGSAGNCAAGGLYVNGLGYGQGFVVVEANGVWGTAIRVPGLAALNKGQNGDVNSVSCAPVGNCAAGGSYRRIRQFPGFHGFVSLGSLG